MRDLAELRDEFPILAEKAYLNAGTQGPLPHRAVAAAERELALELRDGRGTMVHFEGVFALAERLRASVAPLLGCEPGEVAMVGDHVANDVAGALAAGLGAAVWVERYPGELPEGAHLVSELAEVPRLLGLV